MFGIPSHGTKQEAGGKRHRHVRCCCCFPPLFPPGQPAFNPSSVVNLAQDLSMAEGRVLSGAANAAHAVAAHHRLRSSSRLCTALSQPPSASSIRPFARKKLICAPCLHSPIHSQYPPSSPSRPFPFSSPHPRLYLTNPTERTFHPNCTSLQQQLDGHPAQHLQRPLDDTSTHTD